MGIHIEAAYSSEIAPDALAVQALSWPHVEQLGAIEYISDSILRAIATQHPAECLFILSGGPPCVNVTHLNADKTGAHGEHSDLREQFKRIWLTLYGCLGDRIVGLLECVRMDPEDRAEYDSVFMGPGRGPTPPFELCSSHWDAVTRPRLWWTSSDPQWPEATGFRQRGDILHVLPRVKKQDFSTALLPGWRPAALDDENLQPHAFNFKCFTTRSSVSKPRSKPRGLRDSSPGATDRWREDCFAQSPYQYAVTNCVTNGAGRLRRLAPCEEERLMRIDTDATACLHTRARNPQGHPHAEVERRRHHLIGNAWHIGVTIFCLLFPRLASPPSRSSTPPSGLQHVDTCPPHLRNLYEQARSIARPHLHQGQARGRHRCGAASRI
jgi:hypothetical protein